MTTIKQVKQLGQQIWLDNLSRSLVQSGELAQFLADGVCGVTSTSRHFPKSLFWRCLIHPRNQRVKTTKQSAQRNLRNPCRCRCASRLAMYAAPNTTAQTAKQAL